MSRLPLPPHPQSRELDMAFDATFFALVGLVLFFVLIAYLKVPRMLNASLDERADNIRDELAEAKRLREEAQHLLAEYQRKRKEAEADAANIIASAEREAAALTAEAKVKTEEFVARRTALSEQKISRAEAEADAANIIAAAEREAAALTAEAKVKTEEFVARRTALSEQKIKQAENDAIGAVRSAAVDIAIAASQKLIAEKTTAAAKTKLFKTAVDEVKSRLN